jgi:hypothetical protein
MMKNLLLLLAAIAGVGSVACQSSGIGDPCIHEREYDQSFSGFNVSEIDVESRSFQCKSRVCLVANFQGRASCPYGQVPGGDANYKCYLPGTNSAPVPGPDGKCKNCVQDITGAEVQVNPQIIDRAPEKAMYCSCRCAGDDKNVRYCECPSGYSCEELITNFGAATGGQLVGSYCIKEGTKVDNPTAEANKNKCDPSKPPPLLPRPQNCGPDVHPAGI